MNIGFKGFALALALAMGLAPPAYSQVSSDITPPRMLMTDDRGVDLLSGQLTLAGDVLSIGAIDAPALSYAALPFSGAGDVGTPRGGGVFKECIPISGHPCPTSNYFFKMGQRVEKAGTASAATYDGSSWVETTSTITLTARDGTVFSFSKALAIPSNYYYYDPVSGTGAPEVAKLESITAPDGVQLTYTYSGNFTRSITSSTGYQLHFEYTSYGWPTRALLLNLAVDYCAPTATTCTSLTVNWPQVSVTAVGSGGPYSAVDAEGRTITTTGWQVSGSTQTLTYTSAAGRSFTLTQGPATTCSGAPYVIKSFQNAAGTWNYQRTPTGCAPSGTTVEVTSTNPAGQVLKVSAATDTRTRTDALNRATIFRLFPQAPFGSGVPEEGGVSGVIQPEGDRADYSYDSRRNPTQLQRTAKSGSSLSEPPVTAHYPACTVATAKICNKPDYTIDTLGNRTDYTYDPAHGGMLTKTLPAGANGIRPQTRYTYEQRSAVYKNASGQLVSGASVWKLTATSTCRTQQTCLNTADEIVTSYGYDGNLLVSSETIRAGNGSVISTVTNTYDGVGNLIKVDGPLPGTLDTTRYVYNAKRELTATMSTDPDGPGPLLVRVTRTTYNGDGQATLVEEGTATSQSDAALAAMTVLRQSATDYDTLGRMAKTRIIIGGSTQAVTQYSYNLAGQQECVAVRMNPATFSSLPSSACTLSATGDYGADRITRFTYDAAGQVRKVQNAYGTANQIDYESKTYSANGKVATATDAKGNVTTYQYDGFDRLWKTIFPTPGNGATPSSSDYEMLTYDAGSLLRHKRLRDGQVIDYYYDALGQKTFTDLPSTAGALNADVTYVYDNVGNLVSATDSGGGVVSHTYDALGRVLSEGNGARTLTYRYDEAGRRKRLTWNDGFFVTYDYLNTGELAAIRENDAASGIGVLATFSYDNLGRRTVLARGNGTQTIYGYDGRRLTSLTQDLAGGAWDQTLGFGYNPANQMVTRTSSNNAYTFTESAVVSRTYSANALNQYSETSAGSPMSFGYDGRGNMTAAGAVTYAYDVRNLMVSSSAGNASFSHDPKSRLRTIAPEGTVLDYDGLNRVAEYDSAGQLKRRYVHGVGEDEPIVWYEGAGTGARRWLHANHQGSIIAVTDNAGQPLAINSFDAYGVPASTNLGAYQFTGQTWLGGLGLYNYKARFYSPSLGRFVQSDPLGYEDDLNFYAYTKNDPGNTKDPTGMSCQWASGGWQCQIDKVPENASRKLRDRIEEARKRYEDDVNKLMKDPDKTVTVSVPGYKSFTVTAGEVAGNLIKAEVIVRADLAGGADTNGGVITLKQGIFFEAKGQSTEALLAFQTLAFVHEGIHWTGWGPTPDGRRSSTGERSVPELFQNGGLGGKLLGKAHQIPYNKAAKKLLAP